MTTHMESTEFGPARQVISISAEDASLIQRLEWGIMLEQGLRICKYLMPIAVLYTAWVWFTEPWLGLIMPPVLFMLLVLWLLIAARHNRQRMRATKNRIKEVLTPWGWKGGAYELRTKPD